MLLNPDPSGSSLSKSAWNAIQAARPYSGLDLPLKEKGTALSQLWSVALPLFTGQAGSDDWLPLVRTRLPKSLFSMWFDPQVPVLTHTDQTLWISGGSPPLRFSSIETYPFDNSNWQISLFAERLMAQQCFNNVGIVQQFNSSLDRFVLHLFLKHCLVINTRRVVNSKRTEGGFYL